MVAVVSQRESCVKLRKTFRNHVNAAGVGSSAAKLFASEISWFTIVQLRVVSQHNSSTISTKFIQIYRN